ncbi:MAG: VIT domain-containing protein [Myxococcota bacterium]|nr:VIT domain-containing protein [Myxococcota bacterium]
MSARDESTPDPARPVRRMPWAMPLVAAAWLGACREPPPPAPTVAFVEPVRGPVRLVREGFETVVDGPVRAEVGSRVVTGQGARAVVRLDAGALVLLDRESSVAPAVDALELTRGRAFVDATDAERTTVRTAHGEIAGHGARFAVELAADATRVHCAMGELTFRGASGGDGRIARGESLVLAAEGARTAAETLWEDWTGGFADPVTRLEGASEPIGVLAGRRLDEIGHARTALPIRGHEVRAVVQGDLVRTTVTQTFFNARSDELEGEWRVRLPGGSVVMSFAVDLGDGLRPAHVVPIGIGPDRHATWLDAQTPTARLLYDGPDRYRARLHPIPPGATVRIVLEYAEWLSRRGRMRSWVYPMAPQGPAPLVGELSLEVDTTAAGAGALRAGMGAAVEGGKVVLRASDARPRADFALDLVDRPDAEPPQARLYVAAARPAEDENDREGYVLLDVAGDALVDPDESDEATARPLELVLLVDVSASIAPEALELARAAVEVALQHLAPTDRIALRTCDVRARAVGAGPEGLAEPNDAHREAWLGALSAVERGGATDLGACLHDAAALVAGRPRGAVLYVGDGLPTTGALDAGALAAQLARIEAPPRWFALAVGPRANVDLLRAIAGAGAFAVADRTGLVRTVLRVLAEAARPTLRAVRVDLGQGVERLYPRTPQTVAVGESVRWVGRLAGELPSSVTVRGVRDGRPFERRLAVTRANVDDGGALRRAWAMRRLEELLDEDAGREALVDLGVRFGLLTPWTALDATAGSYPTPVYRHLANASALPAVALVRGFDRDPYEPAWSLGGRGPSLERTGLQGASGWRRRTPGGAAPAETDVVPESTWSARDLSTLAASPRAQGADDDGGLARAALRRALREGLRGPQVCYERRLSQRPDLSGSWTAALTVDGTGGVVRVEPRDRGPDDELVACVRAELEGLRLPGTGARAPITLTHTFWFELPSRPVSTRRHCSDASRQSLEVRVALWRERLEANRGPRGARDVWRIAMEQCELPDWASRRALLDLALRAMGGIEERIALYRAFAGDAAIAAYLREAILRSVRTPAEVAAVRAGLELDVPVDWALFARLWEADPSPERRLQLVRRWLEVVPDDLDLRVRLLGLLERTGALAEARRVARELVADALADAKVRAEVAEFWLRLGDRERARRVLSEIVERAPLDPWARRRLGDLYRAHGWHDEAHREYETYARLRSADMEAWLLLARAAAGAGRIDEALRLEERLSESTDADVDDDVATHARLWSLVRLARLHREARDEAERARIARRRRQAGVLREPPDLLAVLVWEHPDDRPTLWMREPSTPPEIGFDAASLDGTRSGVMAALAREREAGDYLFEVRRADRDSPRPLEGELWLFVAPGSDRERVFSEPIRLTASERVVRFRLDAADRLERVPIPAPPPAPR